jgi:hypothetical protein
MEIKVRDLRKLIREALFLEYTLSNNVTLYHRSPKKFKVGDTLTAQVDPATGNHWLAKKQYEKEMEEYRKKHYPNLPSRFNCIYSSFSPRSRFIGKGYLYAVKPIGKTHITDSKIIDQLGRNSWKDDDYGYDSSLIEDYWKGVEPRRGNIDDMEIMSESAEVIEVVGENKRLQRGELIVFGSGAPTIKAVVRINRMKKGPQDEGWQGIYAANGNDVIKLDAAMDRLNVAGVSLGDIKKGSWDDMQHLTIGPGFMGTIAGYRGQEPGRDKSSDDSKSVHRVPSITLSPGSDISGKNGISISLDHPTADAQFIKAFRLGTIQRRD